jgi:hypothetical protein
MRLTYKISSSLGITVIRFLSVATYDGIVKAVNDLADSSSIDKRLWDLTAGLDMSSLETQNLAEFISEKLPRHAKAAVVAPDGLAFGVSRMLEARRINMYTTTFIFRTMDEAVHWLNSDE